MKIDNSGLNRISRQETEAAAALEKSNAQNETAAGVERFGGKDRATLSERARLLARARVAMDETPEVRTDKVGKLREEIETGNYQPPLQEVVKRLVSQVRLS
jgi:flagellar biosynthesis anti-sigma factor FlgM